MRSLYLPSNIHDTPEWELRIYVEALKEARVEALKEARVEALKEARVEALTLALSPDLSCESLTHRRKKSPKKCS